MSIVAGRDELPFRSAGDAGMVPLSSRETAKDGKTMTQLAALKQVSSFFQRIHPRAKRKPDPRIKALQPGSSPLGIVGKRGRRFALPGGRLQLKLKSDLKQ